MAMNSTIQTFMDFNISADSLIAQLYANQSSLTAQLYANQSNLTAQLYANQSTTKFHRYNNNWTPKPIQITYFIISACGVCFNLFTLSILCLYKPMHKSMTNIFIANQSIVDAIAAALLVLTFLSRQNTFIKTPGKLSDEILCRIWITAAPMWAMLASSTYNIIAITFERFLAVVYPIWHKTNFTRKHVAGLISAVWLIGPSYYIPYFILTTAISPEDGDCETFVVYGSLTARYVSGTIFFLFIYVVPLASLTYFYARMNFALRRTVPKSIVININPGTSTSRETAQGEQNGVFVRTQAAPKESEYTARARYNIIKTLALVSVGFMLSWGFNEIFFFLVNLQLIAANYSGGYFQFSVIMIYTSCFINPLIYCAQYTQFQQGVKWVFCRNRLKHGVVVSKAIACKVNVTSGTSLTQHRKTEETKSS